MKKVGVAKIALVLAIGTLPLLQCSLPADEAEKIPLTTSSSEALDLFLQVATWRRRFASRRHCRTSKKPWRKIPISRWPI